MAKTKEQKKAIVKDFDNKIKNMKSAVLVDYQGLKVVDIEELRKRLRKQKVSFCVSKNSLTKIALKKNGIELEEGIFTKPLALAFAMDDETAPAKEITLFAKSNEAIDILGGILENKFIDEAMVKKLGALPSRGELRGSLVATIAAPMFGMVNVIGGNLIGLINALSELKAKKS